jgi:trans-2,3-dihydro-3-hydroxyanthranilate isomerase
VRYRYFICDVFTDVRFGGNQLAVLPEASGLSDLQMQQVATEFNFSETTFVFPPEAGQTRKVRIFTPKTEIPFAGHPNVGTAFVLASAGEFGSLVDEDMEVRFEEAAGVVPIRIRQIQGSGIWCELAAPQALSLGPQVEVLELARMLSLEPGDVATETHAPRVASVGLPFICAELVDRAALERSRVAIDEFERFAKANDMMPDVHVYIRSGDDFDLRARMFAPLDGVAEDPATGSANCALAGLLAHRDERANGELRFRIAQGVEMGRPSLLEARAEKRNGAVTGTWVGGSSVLVAEGVIEVD